jgi:hypothetical protein
MADMGDFMLFCIGYHVVMGVLFAGGYYCWRAKVTTGAMFTSECPYRKSMKFGLWVGALLGVPQLMTYVWLPFDSATLPLAWGVAELVKWTLAGAILNKLYKPV